MLMNRKRQRRSGENAEGNSSAIGPALLWAWLAGRSIARGLPLPQPAHGGMCVETASPDELRRYVFSGPCAAIEALATATREARIFIKMCGDGDQLLALVPPRWQLQPGRYLMTQASAHDQFRSPLNGYRIEVAVQGAVIAARAYATDGSIAASGYAVERDGAFVFDRIVTSAAHRRRGLGRAIMSALGAMQRSKRSQRVLVATEEGRAMYSALGWTTKSPYSTIVIPSERD